MIHAGNIHQTLVSAGLSRFLANHRSDLYVVVNPQTSAILAKHENARNITYFVGQEGSTVAGLRCADVPFAFDPDVVDLTRMGSRQVQLLNYAVMTNGLITVHSDDVPTAQSLVKRGILAGRNTRQDYALTKRGREMLLAAFVGLYSDTFTMRSTYTRNKFYNWWTKEAQERLDNVLPTRNGKELPFTIKGFKESRKRKEYAEGQPTLSYGNVINGNNWN